MCGLTADQIKIHVFYLSSTNTILEQAYKAGRGWGRGDIPEDIHVAPYSKLAAAFHPGSDDDLRLYAQKTDDTIQE